MRVQAHARKRHPQKLADVGKNLRIACRVEPMASIIQALPADLEASRVSADNRLLLYNCDARLVLTTKLVSRSNARRPGAKNHYVGLVHRVSRTMRSRPRRARWVSSKNRTSR